MPQFSVIIGSSPLPVRFTSIGAGDIVSLFWFDHNHQQHLFITRIDRPSPALTFLLCHSLCFSLSPFQSFCRCYPLLHQQHHEAAASLQRWQLHFLPRSTIWMPSPSPVSYPVQWAFTSSSNGSSRLHRWSFAPVESSFFSDSGKCWSNFWVLVGSSSDWLVLLDYFC